MPEAAFMPPASQSEYAFPSGQGDDEAAASDQRNQQIQSSFDQQRFQRAFIQGLMSSERGAAAQSARQQAQIDQLAQDRQQSAQAQQQQREIEASTPAVPRVKGY